MSTTIVVRGTAWDPPLSPHGLQNFRLARPSPVDVMQLFRPKTASYQTTLYYILPHTPNPCSYPSSDSSAYCVEIGAQERSSRPFYATSVQSWMKPEVSNIMTWTLVGGWCSGPSILPQSRRAEPRTMTCRRGPTGKESRLACSALEQRLK